ncbi:hypothetical protein LY76DRAFT_596910 [Colletotrichum caudatum]|nr:hypothetical protein LY76DRAFT_596910 [Colletotrichum caudatum]
MVLAATGPQALNLKASCVSLLSLRGRGAVGSEASERPSKKVTSRNMSFDDSCGHSARPARSPSALGFKSRYLGILTPPWRLA